jgi:predicted oxidoreductase
MPELIYPGMRLAMRTQRIAQTELDVSRVALGCMRLSDPARVLPAVKAALDAGINFFDHADVYGRGSCEEVFSAVWKEFPGLRSRVIVQSKCGIRFPGDSGPDAPRRFDFSYEHIVESVEGSLRRLKTDYLDILLLHRADPLIEPEEVARAFDELKQGGKVRYFGVSNHTGPQIDLLRRYLLQPLVANQLQVSVVHTALLDTGIITNRYDPPTPVRGDGTLEYCRLHDIAIQAWSPLAGGLVGRAAQSGDERMQRTASLAGEMALAKGVSAEAILVAWVLRHPARIQAVVGTTSPERILAMAQADAVELSREEWYRLFLAGRGRDLP